MNEPEIPNPPAAVEPEPVMVPATEVELAINQLRAMVCMLVLALLTGTFAFGLFVHKQCRHLYWQITSRTQQIKQMQDAEKKLSPLLNGLVNYSAGKPELEAIFARYGMQIRSNETNRALP